MNVRKIIFFVLVLLLHPFNAFCLYWIDRPGIKTYKELGDDIYKVEVAGVGSITCGTANNPVFVEDGEGNIEAALPENSDNAMSDGSYAIVAGNEISYYDRDEALLDSLPEIIYNMEGKDVDVDIDIVVFHCDDNGKGKLFYYPHMYINGVPFLFEWIDGTEYKIGDVTVEKGSITKDANIDSYTMELSVWAPALDSGNGASRKHFTSLGVFSYDEIKEKAKCDTVVSVSGWSDQAELGSMYFIDEGVFKPKILFDTEDADGSMRFVVCMNNSTSNKGAFCIPGPDKTGNNYYRLSSDDDWSFFCADGHIMNSPNKTESAIYKCTADEGWKREDVDHCIVDESFERMLGHNEIAKDRVYDGDETVVCSANDNNCEVKYYRSSEGGKCSFVLCKENFKYNKDLGMCEEGDWLKDCREAQEQQEQQGLDPRVNFSEQEKECSCYVDPNGKNKDYNNFYELNKDTFRCEPKEPLRSCLPLIAQNVARWEKEGTNNCVCIDKDGKDFEYKDGKCVETNASVEGRNTERQNELQQIKDDAHDYVESTIGAKRESIKAAAIENVKKSYSELENLRGDFKTSVWKNKEGKFNTARLLSDSVAGIALGTVGGVVTHNVVEKNQLEDGFEDLKCTVAGQEVARFDEVFQAGIQ